MDQLKKKARQLLQVEEVINLYSKLAKEEERDQEDIFYLGSLLYTFGNSPEFKTIQEENKKAINEILKTWKGRNNEPGFIADLERISIEHLTRLFNKALELKEAGLPAILWPEGMKPEEAESYLAIANSQLYFNFRDRMSKGRFNLNNGGWPEADLSGTKISGKMIMKPDNISPVIKEPFLLEMQEAMREKVADLAKNGDLAADIFDIITAKYIKAGDNPYKPISITADDFLQARGLKKMLSGSSGRRGGYKDEWRQEIAKYIYILSDAFIEVAEMEVYEKVKGKRQRVNKRHLHSRAVILSSLETQERIGEGPEIYKWYVRPGDCFIPFLSGPGRQTALLSQKALAYDYSKYKVEKRIARYLAYIWRIDEGRTREGLLVKTLLDKAGEEVNQSRPGRTRDRLEKALEQLQADGVITAWQYESIDENKMKGRQWWRKWIELKIILTAPAAILRQYSQIEQPKERKR